jgi:hypothetical protein
MCAATGSRFPPFCKNGGGAEYVRLHTQFRRRPIGKLCSLPCNRETVAVRLVDALASSKYSACDVGRGSSDRRRLIAELPKHEYPGKLDRPASAAG